MSSIKQPSWVFFMGETPLGQNTKHGRSFTEGLVVRYVTFYLGTPYTSPAPAGYWYTPEIAGRPTPSPGNPIARVNHSLSWNSLLSDGSGKVSSKAQLITLTNHVYGGVANSQGMMFWLNRTQ
jgi:hypothetical protein